MSSLPCLEFCYPVNSFAYTVTPLTHYQGTTLSAHLIFTLPARATRLRWLTRCPPPCAHALPPRSLFLSERVGTTFTLADSARRTPCYLTPTHVTFAYKSMFTRFALIPWKKTRSRKKLCQDASNKRLFTRSTWEKLNFFFNVRILLVIAGVEMNPGPSRNNKHTRHITIAHVNINSITAPGKLQELQNFVNINQISILALSETKLDDSVHPNLYAIDDFHPPLTRHRNRHGGGTAIYIHNSLTFSRIPSLELSGEEWIWAKIKVKKRYISHMLHISYPSSLSATTARIYGSTD